MQIAIRVLQQRLSTMVTSGAGYHLLAQLRLHADATSNHVKARVIPTPDDGCSHTVAVHRTAQ